MPRFGFVLAAVSTVVCLIASPDAVAAEPIDFARDIRPLLSDTCYLCHGPDAETRASDLRLDQHESALSDLGGYHAVVPGKSEKSELIRRITSDDPDVRMPPPDSGRQLTEAQINLLKRWIADGAKWEDHWAFVPPRRPELPKVEHADWPQSAIDHFIAAKLQEAGLNPSPEADKATLIRRVTLDLTGLPPSLAEVDAFLADDSPDAYERLVDRLLASPRYGEHMAAPWLDAARYSDTNGYQQDRTRTMWPWRDWVVQSLNANMPFDQFTIEQLAGDLLDSPTPQQHLATGFHRNHPLNGEGGRIAEESRVEYVVDRVDTTATVWLGLTAGCARCHDHKYDPLSQREFYQFYDFFNHINEVGGVDRGGNANPVMKIATPEQARRREQLEQQLADINRQLSQPPEERQFAAWQKQLATAVESGEKQSVWSPVEVIEMKSSGGQTMELRGGIIVTSGKNPAKDDYAITVRTDLKDIKAIRIEAIADEAFTNGGFARSDSGNFVLTSFSVAFSKEGESEAVKLASAKSDFEQSGWPIKNALNDDPNSGWAVYNPPNMRIDRHGVFTFAQPVAGGDGTTLVVTMKHQSRHAAHNLGHFRLSVTSQDDPPFQSDGLSPALIAAVKTPADQRTQQQTDLLVEKYRQEGEQFAALRGRQAKLTGERDKLAGQYPEVMVMARRGSPRETFVLKRGQYDQPDREQPAKADVPGWLPPLPEDAPRDRLGLARWLMSPDNPLTARVTVNRHWQHFFGRGLVETTEDFGSQGSPPTHPRLLDHLAIELVESGWNIKRLHRQIVTSSAYRQSSAVTPQQLEADPQNTLLGRGARQRLDSFTLRDQALALGGLLIQQTGGPPVRPYQPPGIWSDFSLGKIKYEQDHGEKLYRRSLYTFWRRSVGPTVFFDTSPRLVCTVKPSRTNTPLHALTMWNETAYVEAARNFAQRALTAGGDTDEARLRWAFRAATARLPSEGELEILTTALTRLRGQFQADKDAAQVLIEVGESPRDGKLNPVELAAYTAVLNLLLNLDEVVTKE